MSQLKQRHHLFLLVLLIITVLLPGCTINIYFINTEPASVGGQSNATRSASELPLVKTPQEEALSLAPSEAVLPNPTNTKYVGSISSNKYHLPDCEWAQKISPSNQVWFASAEEARSKGYLPCKVCQPPSQ